MTQERAFLAQLPDTQYSVHKNIPEIFSLSAFFAASMNFNCVYKEVSKGTPVILMLSTARVVL